MIVESRRIGSSGLGWSSVMLVVALATACGDSKGRSTVSSPSGPSASRPVIVAAVAAAPLKATVITAPSGPSRYEIIAHVSFRETAGTQGRVVRLVQTVLDESGPLTAESGVTLDVEVPAMGTVSQEVRHVFELTRTVALARWRLAATGLSADGAAFDISPIEVQVEFGAAAPPPPAAGPSVSFVGAGDIAECGSVQAEATARLLDGLPGTVFTLGDNVYMNGTPETYRDCYGPTWGRHRARTRPVAGNHDWNHDGGMSYFDYFGPAAGPRGLGYYSYQLGAWHVLALNSNLHGNAGSAQHAWVQADLATNRAQCVLAYWHHPRFSSGPNGSDTTMRDIWRLLQDAGAELVLSGHDHGYERFAPQDADGRLDTSRGIRQFVVGTGGYRLYDQRGGLPNVDARDDRTWGVLNLTLRPAGYDWEFVPIAGQSYRDQGTAACTP
jgi:hypothetical protein